MTIKAGDKMPEGAFTRMTSDGPQKDDHGATLFAR